MNATPTICTVLKVVLLYFIVLTSCSDNTPTNSSNSPKRIISFEFSMDKNDIPVNSEGKIEENQKTVQIFLPPGTDLNGLVPDFQLSKQTSAFVNGSKVVPGETPLDFSTGIEMTLRHEDNSEVTYVIIVITDDPEIDTAMKKMMDEFGIPGLQIAIVYQERLVYTQSYGWADVENEVPVTSGSLFRIASVSKPITTIALLKLMEEGKLSMDEIVFGSEGVLGFDYGTLPYGSHIEEITVKHLIEHESGWTNQPYDPVFSNYDYSQKEMIDDVLDNRPNSEPGEESEYLNFGYVVLGRVIEKVSGLEYDEYIKQEILEPIGVTSMEVGRNSIEERYENEVIYYPSENFDPYDLDVPRMDAAGGWIASAEELVKLLVHVDRNNQKDDLLSSNSLGYSFLSYTTWIVNGGMAGSNASLSRINNDLGAAILANTRIPGGTITEEMNNFMTEEINSRTNWPAYDLFKN